jgi:glycosyltransferase involved in cell wall biosynthesis
MAKNGLVSFLYVGRFSPVKHVDSIVLAFVAYSKASKVSINLDIYAASLGRDAEYEKLVREKAGIAPSIHFQGAARYEALPQIYRTHDVLLNATESGSFDKVLFEAMASGCLVVASNGGYRDMVPEKYRTALCPKDTTAPAFESSLKALVDISAEDRELFRKKMREIVVQKHSLECLITKIVEFSK